MFLHIKKTGELSISWNWSVINVRGDFQHLLYWNQWLAAEHTWLQLSTNKWYWLKENFPAGQYWICISGTVLKIDPELILRLKVRTWSIISSANRSVINRLSHLCTWCPPSAHNHQFIYLHGCPRETGACVIAHIPQPQWSTTGDSTEA